MAYFCHKYRQMKKLLFIVFLLSAGTLQAQEYHLKFKSVTELQQFMRWTPSRYPLVSCHRGGTAPGFPENAIETFANAIKYMPAVIECDAALSKDSVLVMMHDDNLQRTSTGAGPVGAQTLADLKKLRLKDDNGKITPYKIPTLEEVLRWGKDKVLFTLDIKKGVPYRKMIEAVRKTWTENCSILITYSATQAKEVHDLAPDLMISASVKSLADLNRLNSMGIPDNRIVAFVGVSAPSQELTAMLHSRGIWCITGTMGNLDKRAEARGEQIYTGLIKQGADILSADRWKEAGQGLASYIKDEGLSSKHIVKTK